MVKNALATSYLAAMVMAADTLTDPSETSMSGTKLWVLIFMLVVIGVFVALVFRTEASGEEKITREDHLTPLLKSENMGKKTGYESSG
jgi:hypothetical protein